MKTLSISDNGKTCVPDFHIRLFACSCFPENDYDAEQWLMLNKMEHDRRLLEGNSWEPSFLNRVAVNSISKRMGKMGAVGMVLHCYFFLMSKGVTPSLEKASRLASEIGYSTEKVYFSVLGKEKTVKLDADQTGLKKAFREYRAVSHILAARNLIPETLDGLESYLWGEQEIRKFAKLALKFQMKVDKIPKSSEWGLVRLINPPIGFEQLDGVEDYYKREDLDYEMTKAYRTLHES